MIKAKINEVKGETLTITNVATKSNKKKRQQIRLKTK